MNNNSTSVIIVLILSVLCLVGGTYLAWIIWAPADVSIDNQSQSVAPITSDNSSANIRPARPQVNTRDPAASPTLVASGYTDSDITIRNFLSDSDVLPLVKDGEVLLYSLGSVPIDDTLIGSSSVAGLQTAAERGYEILFSKEEGTFMVRLLKEPLGTLRVKAANELMAKLGIEQQKLCRIQVAVLVVMQHPTLQGHFIGLPGCQGAVQLPD